MRLMLRPDGTRTPECYPQIVSNEMLTLPMLRKQRPFSGVPRAEIFAPGGPRISRSSKSVPRAATGLPFRQRSRRTVRDDLFS